MASRAVPVMLIEVTGPDLGNERMTRMAVAADGGHLPPGMVEVVLAGIASTGLVGIQILVVSVEVHLAVASGCGSVQQRIPSGGAIREGQVVPATMRLQPQRCLAALMQMCLAEQLSQQRLLIVFREILEGSRKQVWSGSAVDARVSHKRLSPEQAFATLSPYVHGQDLLKHVWRDCCACGTGSDATCLHIVASPTMSDCEPF
jgi:hypothetical protein